MKRSKLAPFRSGLEDLLQEYCSGSSIHGVQYMGCRKRSWCERFWWMMVFGLSVASCAFLIRQTYVKWDQTPVIVSFAEKSTPVWQIPFPVVTICPQTKVDTYQFNFTKEFNEYKDLSLKEQLAHKRSDQILAMMQLCERSFFQLALKGYNFSNYAKPPNYAEIIMDMSMDTFKFMRGCTMACEDTPCPLLFTEIMTEDGMCVTFNGLSPNELLRNEALQLDVPYIFGGRPSHWSHESGYSSQAKLKAYPFRAIGPGVAAGLSLRLRTLDEDIDYLCRGPVQGFKLLLHSPADYPQISKKFFHIPMEAAINIAIKPQMITTSSRLRDYTPDLRHCFFNHERYLQFFRVYSQDNCELECLTNYTLHRCGCVKFSMPRAHQTRLCDPSEILCTIDAETDLMEMDLMQHYNSASKATFRASCNCLPGCVSMQYDAEITTTDFNWAKWVRTMKISSEDEIRGMQISQVGIYYKEPQFMTSKRSELYGMTDFLANCGGIMGLCMGISLLSLVELVYFCSVRPAMLWHSKRKSKKLEKEEESESPVDSQSVVVVIESVKF